MVDFEELAGPPIIKKERRDKVESLDDAAFAAELEYTMEHMEPPRSGPTYEYAMRHLYLPEAIKRLTNKELRIEVRKRADDWHAQVEGKPGVWQCGQTYAAAVGELLMSHKELAPNIVIIQWKYQTTGMEEESQ